MLLRLRLFWLLLLGMACQPGLAQPAAWHQVPLDSVATLEFPDSVSRSRDGEFQLYTCVSEATIYLAMRKPTSSFIGLLSSSPRFYDGMVQQWIQEIDGKLLSRRAIAAGAFKGVEIEFATPKNPALPATKFTRMVVVDTTVYVLNCWTNAEPAVAVPERARFFNSFRVKAQPALRSSAYRAGHWLGRLAAYALAGLLFIGLLVGGIVLLRRRRTTPS